MDSGWRRLAVGGADYDSVVEFEGGPEVTQEQEFAEGQVQGDGVLGYFG